MIRKNGNQPTSIKDSATTARRGAEAQVSVIGEAFRKLLFLIVDGQTFQGFPAEQSFVASRVVT